MEKYLSIGEVAKLKGVGIKSLRYYDRLGILSPAYINPETGYRYYLPSQLILVDLISFCIRLNIPLKNFHGYVQKDMTIDIEKILSDARRITEEKMQTLQSNMRDLEYAGKHLQSTLEIKKHTSSYFQTYGQRSFLTKPLPPETSAANHLTKAITVLYQRARCKGWGILHNHGLLMTCQQEKQEWLAFLEVDAPPCEDPALLMIPAGNYACFYFADTSVTAAQTYANQQGWCKNPLTIIRELYDVDIQWDKNPMEIQTWSSPSVP